ncbi:lysylphosphatidylglycerol synthase domain-containing protein [Paenibacillus thermoaerophilus]|uniref:Phosphatidylglycerol lysyltransferase n=1 Tax=Paenibacillus thermoaerophilus TaxID=1215385 RepID=A0ABW2V2Y9_9BACL|nr:lysylphosphatidylglycerol synthase transmembrane domain-containing protein [Paenibacillus thermoaerophilus]TMV11032.1 flippase-like domain-containing protein [Paenibacillus thermoaerophilus]
MNNDTRTSRKSLVRKWLFTGIKYGLVVLVVYFMYRNIRMTPLELWNYLRKVTGEYYGGIAVFLVFLVLQAGLWIALLNRGKGAALPLTKGLMIYTNSMFAKYLPGGFWNFVGRVYMTRKEGVAMDRQISVLVYENFFLALVSLLYAAVLMASVGWIPGWTLLLVGLLLVGMYVFYKPVASFMEKLTNKYGAKLGGVKLDMPRQPFFLYLGGYLLNHFLQGCAFWLLLQSFGIDSVSVIEASGMFALAWLLGVVSPLPGGIGIREGALALLLATQMDLATATQMSIMTRIWNLFGEIALYVMVNSIYFVRKRLTA